MMSNTMTFRAAIVCGLIGLVGRSSMAQYAPIPAYPLPSPEVPPAPVAPQQAESLPPGFFQLAPVNLDVPADPDGPDDEFPVPTGEEEGLPAGIRQTSLTYGSLRVDALLVIDTNATANGRSLSNALRVDARRMVMLLESAGVRPTVIEGNDVSIGAIRRHYDRVRESGRRPDVSLFYYTGHGHSIPDDVLHFGYSHGNMFDLNDGRQHLWRSQVRKMVLSTRPRRLAVLMSDCCSSVEPSHMAYATEQEEVVGPHGEAVFRSLLFGQVGMVDLTSSRRGQSSSCNGLDGSSFTSAFFKTIAEADERSLAANAEWRDVFSSVRDKVSSRSRGRQVPDHFSLGHPAAAR